MSPAKRYMELVARAGCALGNRGLHVCEHQGVPCAHVHHVRGVPRNDFATVGLCWGGHQGPAGVHGMGSHAFCRLYRVPGETELGLLAWAAEDIFKIRRAA